MNDRKNDPKRIIKQNEKASFPGLDWFDYSTSPATNEW
ncbi:hypothetical protein BSI_40610 [Bacillus inaquosorum KCTC 13429]|uniref:Uncharacterized protein n=1 Tax=Bacillus inaquosorum KCTC 13429 TaxID=1236548 RepID=A0A9W5PB66_9BACI|nr:hypothetical protein BSI_40610 [Bacillus inaquosorum KCTC 13429]